MVFPEAGSIVPEWSRADVRETFVANYRVVYRVKEGLIEVLAVIHGARQFPGQDKVISD
ncbi:MAG: type II toxin-antitoxin system RelE/ParE family toxin [Planctomycetes bacterium]|nr:type II toxin-antitoxin system RelE/ParE family toxin [Planctomycetota bacterium]